MVIGVSNSFDRHPGDIACLFHGWTKTDGVYVTLVCVLRWNKSSITVHTQLYFTTNVVTKKTYIIKHKLIKLNK